MNVTWVCLNDIVIKKKSIYYYRKKKKNPKSRFNVFKESFIKY